MEGNDVASEINAHLERFGEHIRGFLKLEASGGILLMVAMVVAMAVSNSPWSGSYDSFLNVGGEVRIGALSVEKPLFLWVNDFWMAIFFFLVGMEIKSELVDGYLSDRSEIALPAFAALGGMLGPALIYVSLNWGDPVALQGWAIPTATDIAFALGVLSLLGSRVSVALRVFLMTLAILDDLGAIVIIALFYTGSLSLLSLWLAGAAIVVLAVLNYLGVMRVGPYVIVGIVLWICVLKSGVHATLAGVVTALAIPARSGVAGGNPPLRDLIHALHPWVAFAVLPMFAFVNTGITFAGLDASLLLGTVPLGIAAGLILGKPLGVFGLAWLAIKLRLARKPPGVSFAQLHGIAALCGIGFTMSLFIGGLAFSEGGAGHEPADRVGVLAGSLIAGLSGYAVLRLTSKPEDEDRERSAR